MRNWGVPGETQHPEVIESRATSTRRLVCLAVLVVVLAACGEADSGAATTSSAIETSPPTSTATTTTTESTSTTGSVAGQIVQVVFAAEDQSDCSNVVAFDRSIDETAEPIETAFHLLAAGPTTDEQAEGAGSFFSGETEGMVLSVQLDRGVLEVDFDDLRPLLNNASTSCGSFSLIAQLNGTAFQFEVLERVSYQIEGSCDTFFTWLQRDCQEYTRP